MKHIDKKIIFILLLLSFLVAFLGLIKVNNNNTNTAFNNFELLSYNKIDKLVNESVIKYNFNELEGAESDEIMIINESDGSGKSELGISIKKDISTNSTVRIIALSKNKSLIFIDDYIIDNNYYRFNISTYYDNVIKFMVLVDNKVKYAVI